MATDPSEATRLPMPQDTLLDESEVSGMERAGITDDSVARAAVELGLCTAEEVEFCRGKQGERGHAGKPLSQLLVESESLTKRQMIRLEKSLLSAEPLARIPGYAMLGKLGEGATASVFRARQNSLNRVVAVKVLPKRFARSPRFVEQLYAEGRLAAKLNHPNIVQAFDVGSHGEFHYFVMECVEGETVHDMILRQGRLGEEESLDIILATARALHHAHEIGLVHRDVKPKNIMITPAKLTKLADLGLARVMTDTALAAAEKGKTLGTPYYMSPEQVRGEEHIGPESDVYSLGATWYFMITGQTAFKGRDSQDIMNRHVSEPLVPPIQLQPDITPGVSDMIVRMMAKSPQDRYRTCEEVAVEVEAWKTYHEMRKLEQG